MRVVCYIYIIIIIWWCGWCGWWWWWWWWPKVKSHFLIRCSSNNKTRPSMTE